MKSQGTMSPLGKQLNFFITVDIPEKAYEQKLENAVAEN